MAEAFTSDDAHRLRRADGRAQRKYDVETRAAARPVGNFDGAVVLLNDTVAHGKAEARALARGLGGEERIVDAVHVFGRDAAAGIGYFDLGTRAFAPRT